MLGSSLISLSFLAAASLQEPPARPVNYEDDLRPIFEASCLDCHRGSRAKNGLALNTYTGLMEGGSSGAAIVPGNASGSLLWQLVAREREPFMPYETEKLDEATLATIRAWIDGGARETATSEARSGPARPLARVELPASSSGAAVFPEGLRQEPIAWSEHGDAVVALAVSPTTPLLAVGLRDEIAFVHLETLAPLGVLAFPEGRVHTLTFSRDGAFLATGGGRGAASGRAVVFDVKTGARLAEVGTEPDVVLACDLSSDGALLALGGPDGVLHVHDLRSGTELYTAREHTDWITALAFSPDGVLLATADRAGLVLVREAWTGRIFHELPPHRSRVGSLVWRGDSLVLTTAAAEGNVRQYEMEGGSEIASWAPPGGALSLAALADGRIASAGRDVAARLWDPTGKELATLPTGNGPLTAIAARPDGSCIIVGGFDGMLSFFENGVLRARIAAAPATLLERDIEAKRSEIAAAESERAHLSEEGQTLGAERAALEVRRSAAASVPAELEPVLVSTLERCAAFEARVERTGVELARAEALERDLGAVSEARATQLAPAREACERAEGELAGAIERLTEARVRALGSGDDPEAATTTEEGSLARALVDGADSTARIRREELAARETAALRASLEARAWTARTIGLRSDATRVLSELESARIEREAALARQQTIENETAAIAEAEAALVDRARGIDVRDAELAQVLVRLQEELRTLEERWNAQRDAIRGRGGRVE